MKKNRWLFVILGVIVLGLALIFSAAFGAGITYFLLQADPVQAAIEESVDTNKEEGVLISGVKPESSAAKAGLVRGDILLKINDEPVNSAIEMKTVLLEFDPGTIVELTVLHGDKTRILQVDLDEYKGFAFLGVGTCDFAKGGKGFPGSPMGDMFIETLPLGAEIVEVIPGSPADEADLRVGDLIIRVNQKPISPKADLVYLIQAYEPGDEVVLEIKSEDSDETREITITLGKNPDNPEKAYLGVAYQISPPMHGFEGGGLPFMDGIPFDELPEGFDGQEGMPHFYFHHDEKFKGELPEGWDEGEGFFHGKPFHEDGMPHFFDMHELPEGVEGAVIISEVMEDTPASEVDLQPGDLIIAVDGDPVEEIEAFVEALQSRQPGDEITLTILREDSENEVQVTLTEHPDDPDKGFLGVLAGSYMVKGEMVFPEGFEENFELELPGAPGGDA